MKRAMIYPALLFLISPLFGADADYSAMFGSDKLKAASAAYEKFGYVSPLVELAKTDAAARKKLDKLVADLKSKSEKSSYARDRLANIYFLAGDREQFEKVANPDFAEAVFSAPDKICPKLDAETYSVLMKYNQHIFGGAILWLCDIGREDIAKKIWDSDGYWKRECQQWNVVSDYSALQNAGVKGVSKKRLIGFLSKFVDNPDAFSATRLYVLTLNDSEYKKEFEAAKKILDTLPPDRRANELLNAFENFGMKELVAEQREKLYEMGKLNLHEKQSLLSSWLYANNNTVNEIIPDTFFDNPNRAKAVKLMEEIAPFDAEASDCSVAIMLVSYYAKIGDSENFSQTLKKIIPKIKNPWKLRMLAKLLMLGYDGFPKDEKLAESLLDRLAVAEKAAFYEDIVSDFFYPYADYYISPKQMQKFLKISAGLGNMDAAKQLLNSLSYADALAFCDSLKDRATAENMKACYQAKNGDWNGALESFGKSAQLGNNYAKLVLACCKYEGRGMTGDKITAVSEMKKLIGLFESSPNVFVYNNAQSQILELFGRKSEVYGKFLDLCANISGMESSARDKYWVLEDYPDVGREANILELSKSFEPSFRDDLFSMGEFLDVKKAKNRQKYNPYDLEYAFSLMSGEDGIKNPEKAFSIFKTNSDYNNAGRFWLAYCYRNGIGTKADSDKAEKLLASIEVVYSLPPDLGSEINAPRLADDELIPFIERYIAKSKTGKRFAECASLYLNGTNGLAPDFVRAVELYEQAAALDGRFFKKLAEVYKNNWKLKDDKKYFENLNRYFDYCKKELSYVPRDAYFDLALCYLNGRGTGRNGAKALAYFEKAVERPYSNITVRALEALAYCAEKGIGQAADPAKAAELRARAERFMLETPAFVKNAVSIANLYDKDGLECNPERKLRWLEFSRKNFPSLSILRDFYDFYTQSPKLRDWKKANEFLVEHAKYAPHSPWGLYRRGLSLVVGAGCEKDAKKGIALLEGSFERGRTEAAEFLAYVYEKGIGVPRDEKLAEKWLTELKKKRRAYRWLAAKYLDGTNFITDADRAKFLLKLGADNGDYRSKFYLENFEKFVSDSQK